MHIVAAFQTLAHDHLTVGTMKAAIIGVAIFLIILAITVDNPWILAGILAYEILP